MYRFLQPAFVTGEILEPSTDLNGFGLVRRKIIYNRDWPFFPNLTILPRKSKAKKKSECLTWMHMFSKRKILE